MGRGPAWALAVADEPEAFTTGAYWLIAIGIVGALLAATFGFLDLFAIPTGTRAFRIGLTHMTLNLIVVALFAVSFLLRRGELDTQEPAAATPVAISVVALAIVGASGWLGGRLSFRYGVRVAEESAQAEGFATRSRPT